LGRWARAGRKKCCAPFPTTNGRTKRGGKEKKKPGIEFRRGKKKTGTSARPGRPNNGAIVRCKICAEKKAARPRRSRVLSLPGKWGGKRKKKKGLNCPSRKAALAGWSSRPSAKEKKGGKRKGEGKRLLRANALLLAGKEKKRGREGEKNRAPSDWGKRVRTGLALSPTCGEKEGVHHR